MTLRRRARTAVLLAAVVAGSASAATVSAAQAAEVTGVKASASKASVRIGAPVSLRGRVAGPGGRKTAVVLQHKQDGGAWVTVDRGRTSKTGSYRVATPARYYGVQNYRVRTSGKTSPAVRVNVRTAYSPKGANREWTLLTPGNKTVWNSCSAIEWKFNPAGGYAGSLNDMKKALAEVTRATGFRFVYRGTTDKIALRDSPETAGTELLISWATPAQVSGLSGNAVAVGGPYSYDADRGPSQSVLGAIALDRTERLPGGFTTSGYPTWGQVMIHETGHVMGLGHAGSENQIMNAYTSGTNHRLGRGDLTGLRQVGDSNRCFSPSAARAATSQRTFDDGSGHTLDHDHAGEPVGDFIVD